MLFNYYFVRKSKKPTYPELPRGWRKILLRMKKSVKTRAPYFVESVADGERRVGV